MIVPKHPIKLTKFIEEYAPDLVQTLQENIKNYADAWQEFEKWQVIANGRAFNRLGACAPKTKTVELNPVLEACQEKLQDTFRHELAHVIAGPKHGHNHYWKAIAKMCGAEPTRCSSIKEMSEPLKEAILKQEKERANHVYECADCGYQTYTIRKRKRVYSHIGCQHKPNRGRMVKVA